MEGQGGTPRRIRWRHWLGGSRMGKVLGWYLTEVVVVFLGITAGFLFDEWRERQALKEQQCELLSTLVFDLQAKREEIQSDLNDFSGWFKAIDLLLQAKPVELESEKVKGELLFFSRITNSYFVAQTPSFEALVAQDQWRILQDDTLARDLYSLFLSSFVTLRDVYTSMDQEKNKLANEFFSTYIINYTLPDSLPYDTYQLSTIPARSYPALRLGLIQLSRKLSLCTTVLKNTLQRLEGIITKLERLQAKCDLP